MALRVFKFGGASVRDSENIRNIASIIEKYKGDVLVLVISAMGKTTNALEKVVKACIQGEEIDEMLEELIASHLKTAEELGSDTAALEKRLRSIMDHNLTLLATARERSKSAIYDQLISLGELFSTSLVQQYLESRIGSSVWQDVRELISTDDNHQEARVDFKQTQANVDAVLKDKLSECRLLITQGFIARESSGLTTSLGREGSDYTAAILAYCLDVEDLAIWKDVPGVLTADPRKFDNVEKIDRMSYKEAIEMTYYGAQVIHPKTIRPLQNKGIRLHVKSFLNPEKEGTVISLDGLLNYPPIVVIQEDVILMQISSRDYSFIAENHLSQIFAVMNRYRIKLCTMRNSAISFTICIKNPGIEQFEALEKELSEDFMIDVFKNLQLYTLRYFNKALIESLTQNKVVLFEERMKYTIQMVVRPALELKERD